MYFPNTKSTQKKKKPYITAIINIIIVNTITAIKATIVNNTVIMNNIGFG